MRPKTRVETGAASSRQATVRLVAALLFCCFAVVIYMRTIDLMRQLFPGAVWGTPPQITVSEPKEVSHEVARSSLDGVLSFRPWISLRPWGDSCNTLASLNQRQRSALFTHISLPPPLVRLLG
jgi:hypothetical protein